MNEKAPVSLKDTTGALRTLEAPYRSLPRLSGSNELTSPSEAVA